MEAVQQHWLMPERKIKQLQWQINDFFKTEFFKNNVEEKRKPRGEIVLLHLMLIFQIS